MTGQTQPTPAPIPVENILAYDAARQTQRDCVCAACWGPLTVHIIRGSRDMHITCPQCGDSHGWVTKTFAEKRTSDSIGEAMDARHNLQQAVPWIKAQTAKSEQDILKSLGF